MEQAGFDPILPTAVGLLLLAALLPAPLQAAEEGWVPVVAKASKIERALSALPPIPHQKPIAAAKPAPIPAGGAVVPPLAAVVPAAETSPDAGAAADIVTGSIDSIESTRMLSPTDTARLFAEDAPPGALITGTVDGPGSDLARGYCVNIAGAATEARAALQRAKLAEAERELGKRIATLEAKSAEYKAWVERRDEFLKRATDALVKIYTQMEPDAASLQLVAMDEETAAALLLKLDPQNASAILNEMAPEKAARLAATIAGAARTTRAGGAPPGAGAPPGPRGEPGQGNPEDRS